MPSPWRVRAVAFLCCLPALSSAALAQRPVITAQPTVGSTAISGVGKPDSEIFICVGSLASLASPLLPCDTDPAMLSGGKPSESAAKDGSFKIALASPLNHGEYVYATQVVAKSKPTVSERASAVVIQPFIAAPPAVGTLALTGRGEPNSQVFVCQSPTPPPSPLKDCSAGAGQMLFLSALPPYVVPNDAAGGYFNATLLKGISAGTSIYLAQVSDGYPAVFSEPVTVGVSTAALSILTPLTAGTTEIKGERNPFATVSICVVGTAPGTKPKDCTKGEGPYAPLKTAGAEASSIPPNPGSSLFLANVATPLAGGSFVYLAQVIEGGPTTFSDPVTVAASTASLAIQGPLIAGATAVTGTYDPNGKLYVCVKATAPSATPPDCSNDGSALTLIGAPAPPTGKPAPGKDGAPFVANFSTGLVAGNFVYLTQVIGGTNPVTFSSVVTVQSIAHEREHTDFVGGTLLSANGASYSQGNIFLALNYDRALYRPGFYSHCPGGNAGSCPNHRAGLNFFFQARLTTIPVNASQTVTTPVPTGTTPTTGNATTTPTVSSFLAAQKAAQFGGGGYMPFMFAHSPHPLFEPTTVRNSTFYVGPVARFGFSTPSGSPSGSSSTSNSSGTTTTSTTTLGTTSSASGQLYNYWFGGARIATADIEAGSLHTRHYFDVGVGKYSNLQSLVCNPKKAPTTPSDPSCLTLLASAPASPNNCTTPTQNGTLYYLCPPFVPAYESRTTLYRLAFEGYLEIPSTSGTSFILGMSANTAMTAFSRRANLDPNNKAPEDIEFLIAYKLDVTKLLSSIKLIGQQ